MVVPGVFYPRRGDDGIMRLFCPTGQRIVRKIRNPAALCGKLLILQQPPTVHGVVFGF